jgi:pyruvate/2-oxoglutarate dehydrogenase complex dihydrolipoamide acyltransferase (E2) component
MGSLGIPPIYHHLYDFGNVPVFMSFGAKEHRYEVQSDGSVKHVPTVSFTVVMDERTVDGFYYATALRYMNRIYRNPWMLDERPETVVEDIP